MTHSQTQRDFIKTNILTKFHSYQTENVACRAYTRFLEDLTVWLSFDPTWSIFKLVKDFIEANILTTWVLDWMVGWMVFYAAFNNISVISGWQFTLFMSFLGFTSIRLGLWSVLPKDTPTKKTQRIQCSSNPGLLDYESNTLPLSHAGPCIGLKM